MPNRSFIYHTSDVITSFSTQHPKVLTEKTPWVITKQTMMSQAMERLFTDDFADLLVIDSGTGKVEGLLSNFDTTTTLSSKKKKEKKNAELLNLQEQCHQMCEAECAQRGGCENHGIAKYGKGWTCVIQCRDGQDSDLGGALDQAETQGPL